MREALVIYRKEMRSYLTGPIPYIAVALFAAFSAWWVFSMRMFLLMRQATLEPLFRVLPLSFAVLVPAIAMRAWAEEIRGGTIETLMTSPVRVRHLVAGKFLAAWTVVAACLLCTAGIAVTAGTLGDLDLGPAIGGYVGALLMGGAFLAIGLWLSSITSNQIVAFLLGFVGCFAFALVDQLDAGGDSGSFLSQISMTARFAAIGRGVLDLRDVAYFVSVTAFFLYLNVESVENRRHA